jgi:hypothetical protein
MSKQAEALSVPTDDRLRLDHDQGRPPTPPSGCQKNRSEAVNFGRFTDRSRTWSWWREPSPQSAGTHGLDSIPASRPKWPIPLKLVRQPKMLNSQYINQIGIYKDDRSLAPMAINTQAPGDSLPALLPFTFGKKINLAALHTINPPLNTIQVKCP